MQFEYDPERLIEEVRKRPGIWDFEDVEYRSKNMRYRLWNEVVNELMQPDTSVTKSEMRELELQLQKKWKSIRDCFQKYVTNPNRTKRPYIYCKQMQFLLKNQELPQNDASSDSDALDKHKRRRSRVWKSKKKLKLVKQEEQTSDEDNDDVVYNNDDDNSDQFEVEITDPVKPTKNSKPDEFVFANVDLKNDADDPDKLFLLSLLPHLKSIPEEFRLNVKMDLMQVLRSANFTAMGEHKIL